MRKPKSNPLVAIFVSFIVLFVMTFCINRYMIFQMQRKVLLIPEGTTNGSIDTSSESDPQQKAKRARFEETLQVQVVENDSSDSQGLNKEIKQKKKIVYEKPIDDLMLIQ